ncbi:hypothetical protein ACEPAI_8847 [Sanghuangporus weigelae]
MPPSRSKKLTEKAKATQDAEALKNEPKVRRGPGRPRKNDKAPATPETPQKSPRKKRGKGPSKKKLHNSDDTIDSDDDDNSDDDYQPDGDLSVNDVVQVANETGPDETTWYREEPDFSILEYEQVKANNDSISFGTAAARGLLDPITSTPARRKDPVTSTPARSKDPVTSTPAVRKSKRDTITVKVLVSDGVGGQELLLSSDMFLHEVISEITDLTRGSCTISRLGVEGPWCRKEGPNKYLPEYLDTQAALNKIFDEVRKHRKEQNKKKTNAPDPKIIVRNLPGFDDTNATKKKGKQATATKSAPAQLNDAQDTYKESMAKIAAKLEASFKCDEHGRLCARLPGARNHITYTHRDIEEHARLLYRNVPGVTYDAPPEALKLLDRKPLDSYSARAAIERIPKSSAPAFSPSEAGQPLTQPATLGIQTTPAEPSTVAAQHPPNMQFPGFMHPAIIQQALSSMQFPSMMPPIYPFMMPLLTPMQVPFMGPAVHNNAARRRPRDWPLVGNWLESLHDDIERGKEPCPPYLTFREPFEKRGYLRLDDIQHITKEELQEIADADNLDVTIGLINRILRYAEQDCTTIQSSS